MTTNVKNAISSIVDGKLDEMRKNLGSALTEKAVKKLEEKKVAIAKSYFGKK